MKIALNIFFTIILSLMIFSCQSFENNQSKKKITGEWIFVCDSYLDTILKPPLWEENQKQGFTFYENGICENKLGYFKNKGKEIFFLGTKTKYKIENDSLKILNLGNNIWESSKIFSISTDTLTLLDSDSIFIKYSKLKYDINDKFLFDKITVSSSGCYGTCPIGDIYIDNQGNVFYSGQYYNTVNGVYTSKISIEKYAEFELNFKKANIENLKNNYCANWTDDETITVTFIRDNKIVKTISDYGHQAPAEFYWAYLPVKYCYQQLDLTAYNNDIKLPIFIYGFETAEFIYALAKSESFFLMMELYNGNSGQYDFEEKYLLDCKDHHGKTVKLVTDGRYYRLKKESSSQVIDIGYNFMEKNNIRKQEKEQ